MQKKVCLRSVAEIATRVSTVAEQVFFFLCVMVIISARVVIGVEHRINSMLRELNCFFQSSISIRVDSTPLSVAVVKSHYFIEGCGVLGIRSKSSKYFG